ncbi:MAG: HAD family phosphatase [Candidatus Diapherotrites archaeon]|nr:HAD family phosphatase [Candidatus Diapherotrites archaeon]
MLAGVVFDLDGTLADTGQFYYPLMRAYLSRFHPGISNEDLLDLIGLSFTQKVKAINKKYGLEVDAEQFVQEVSLKAREQWKLHLTENFSAQRLVSELKLNGVQVALATNNSLRNVVLILEKIGLPGAFPHMVTTEDLVNPKPHPEVYLKALQKMGLNATDVVAVEDTSIGLQSAREAGLKVVVIPNPLLSRPDLAGADLVINHLSELNYSVLNKLAGGYS